MSIINDALKKAQAHMENQEGQKDVSKIYEKLQQEAGEKKVSPPPPPARASMPSSTKPTAQKPAKSKDSSNKNLTPVLLVVLILLGAIFIVYKFVLKGSLPSFMTKSKTWTPNYNPPPPPKKNYAPNEFIFSGTMMTGETRVALINDDVYSVGDTIQGKTIANITRDEVELVDAAGQKTTLKIGKK